MKKVMISLIILVSMIVTGHAQDRLKIGELRNGKVMITNAEGLRAYFMKSLEGSGSLSKEYQVSLAPEGDRCFVFYPVSGNNKGVRSIGILLVKSKNDFFIVVNSPATEAAPGGSGSVEITCVGEDGCVTCMPNVKWSGGDWMPTVFCECKSPIGGECNMTSKIVIKIEL